MESSQVVERFDAHSFLKGWIDWLKKTVYVAGLVWIGMTISVNFTSSDEMSLSVPSKSSYKLGAK